MGGRASGLLTVGIVLLVIGGFGFILYNNSQPTAPLVVVVPTQPQPTVEENPWNDIFRPGFGDDSTPLPTIAIPAPDQRFVAPTIIPTGAASPTAIEASELLSQDLFTLEPVSAGATPTPPPPTAETIATDDEIVEGQVQRRATIPWQPPPLDVPISRDPLGRDHYWLARPVDSSGQNFGIFNYPYGSTGTQFNNPGRIHHGIDMPNEVGAPVRAAASGTVLFASSEETPYFQGTSSYGNVVFIEHDFGWENQPVYTLYAHLQAPNVVTGERVEMGQVIGLNGNSGRSSGAHVHFEVRYAGDRYGDTLNPALWLAPYVGHGTIAGRLLDENGDYINNADVTLRDWATNLIVTSTTTYNFADTVDDVNPDPNWQENFVFADVEAGRYEVVANYEGRRLSQIVDVREGLTSPVELQPIEVATAQPVANNDEP